MELIISIRHKYAERIYSGEKTYELRKREPKIKEGTRCWIYEPLPKGKITGYFYYGGCMKGEKHYLFTKHNYDFGISQKEYLEYFRNNTDICAWKVMLPRKIKQEITLEDCKVKRPPQSYMFINSLPSNY